MQEIKITLQEIHPIELLGSNNQNIKLIQAAYPKLKIVSRGADILIIGEEEESLALKEKIELMIRQILKFTNLTEERLADILGGTVNIDTPDMPQDNEFILMSKDGHPIKAKTPNQIELVKSVYKNDLVFAIGPAGTGKTYTSVALAVRALKKKEIKRIIITRPAVEAGENLGFLPGDLKEKIDPYLRPIYDALDDMIQPDKLKQYLETRVIEVAPLAFMRGRTLNNAYVILDEAQNATHTQLKMFLTRMGPNAKFIITGDLTQIDLPKKTASGLLNAVHILKDINGVGIVELSVHDVLRHKLVKSIVTAYDRFTFPPKEKNS